MEIKDNLANSLVIGNYLNENKELCIEAYKAFIEDPYCIYLGKEDAQKLVNKLIKAFDLEVKNGS